MAKQRKGTGTPRQNPPKDQQPRTAPVTSAAPPSRGRREPDVAVIARAAGVGFVILTAGILIRFPVITLFLAVVSAAVAGWMTGRAASKPILHGALAALLGLALTLPVWYLSGFVPILPTAIAHVVTPIVVGALAGRIGARSAEG